MSFKTWAEDWLDETIGRPGRKMLEQALHALMVGIPAFLAVHWLPVGVGLSVGLSVALAAFLGGGSEYLQNLGDMPDEDTLFSFGKLPVNADMLTDMAAYLLGGVLAGVAAGML